MRYMNKVKITNYKSNESNDLSQDKDFLELGGKIFVGAEKLGSMFANENTKKNSDN